MAEQLQKKRELTAQKLSQIESAWRDEKTIGITASPSVGFRNKAKLAVTGRRHHHTLGITGARELDDGVDLVSCPIHHPMITKLFELLGPLLNASQIEPYCIQSRTGELKGLIAFYSPTGNELYLRFVCKSLAPLLELQEIAPSLMSSLPQLACVTVNVQPVPHAILEGSEEYFITPRTTISHSVAGHPTQLDPRSFVQTNQEVAVELHGMAASWVAELGAKSRSSFRLVDLYCGQGAFSFFLAENVGQILGIEVNPNAVALANENAKNAALTHLNFESMPAEQASLRVRTFNPDILLVNPPRKGLADAASWIRGLAPKYLIYSSCNIESMTSDLSKFADRYEIERAHVFDLFPHTPHFETLALLKRKA